MKINVYAVATIALALGISACASAPEARYENLTQVRTGLTKNDVLRLAGRPGDIRTRRNGELWVYTMPNAYDGRVEYDITFDVNGVVTDKRTLEEEG